VDGLLGRRSTPGCSLSRSDLWLSVRNLHDRREQAMSTWGSGRLAEADVGGRRFESSTLGTALSGDGLRALIGG
jgi:hypothetical protein